MGFLNPSWLASLASVIPKKPLKPKNPVPTVTAPALACDEVVKDWRIPFNPATKLVAK
jgi:hypothetical protein